ncbi:HAD family hydrolase [Pararhodonellum marinum]|uniref:HAD family hydrolase n=1 Tax=Pararhodonellum marinum TaxID=2755358 RepID=UPI00188F825E|nr:HAD family hydrolase [Pararhodonellum marinum]
MKSETKKFKFKSLLFCIMICIGISCTPATSNERDIKEEAAEELLSWQEGSNKKAIIEFVKKTTTAGSPDFVPESDRIACFDNDGTLWSEQPLYFELQFAIDQVKTNANDHPEWKNQQTFKAMLEGDHGALVASGEQGLKAIMAATHAGMNADEFQDEVRSWLRTERHPTTNMPYNKMVFQPMIELMEYLRKHGYKTFIVSGGEVDFMRAWAEEAYKIPTYHMLGSFGGFKYEFKDGKGELKKLPEIKFMNDNEGKPVGIHQSIGRIPVIAIGNSDGDYEMLQYTTTADGPRLGMLIHHTDGDREFAYDRDSRMGQLSKGLDSAAYYNWHIIDMKNDWTRIYPE